MKRDIDDEDIYTDVICSECESEFHIKVIYTEHSPEFCCFCGESLPEYDTDSDD